MNFRALWHAARPKTLTASVVPVMVGSALVFAQGLSFAFWISFFALGSAIMIQLGTNFINDALDFIKGADSETRLGEARASQQGWLSPQQVLWVGISCLLIAACLGAPLVWEGGWPILGIGMISLAMGYLYTGGPFPLAYIGLGDVFVVLFFGLVAVGGVFFLATKTYSLPVFIAGLQIGMLATVLIAINNLRDLEEDRKVNKKTLAVRLGPRLGRLEVLFLIVVAFALNIFWLQRGFFWASALPILSLPLALRVAYILLRSEPSRRYNQLLAQAAGVHFLFGLLLSTGLVLQ